MNCPNCNGETKVIRSHYHSDHIERRRKCLTCGLRFATVEIDSDLYERIIRNNEKQRIQRTVR